MSVSKESAESALEIKSQADDIVGRGLPSSCYTLAGMPYSSSYIMEIYRSWGEPHPSLFVGGVGANNSVGRSGIKSPLSSPDQPVCFTGPHGGFVNGGGGGGDGSFGSCSTSSSGPGSNNCSSGNGIASRSKSASETGAGILTGIQVLGGTPPHSLLFLAHPHNHQQQANGQRQQQQQHAPQPMMSTPLPPLPPPSAAQWLHPGSSPHPPGQVFFREPGWHSGSPSPKPAEHVFSIHRSSSDPEAPEAGGGSCTGGRGPGGCEPVSGGSTCSSPTAAVSPRSLRETHYCAVCSDLASGYHYGVWSCEGCKAFFKRSIQGKTNYICPATNQCTIDKNRRKSCQACRLRKCHEVGMVRDACRRDRRGGGGALRGPAGAAARNPAQNPPNHKRSCSETDSATGRPSPAPAAASPEAPECKRNPSEPPAVNQMLTSLMEAEPPKVLSLQESKQPFSEASLMNVLTNLADRELVHMIAWAKKIPGFMDINLEDQVQLLESCWLEVLMVGLIWRSMTHPGKLVFAADLVLERDDGCCVEGIVDIFDLLLRTASQFIELSVTLEEFICLKAMVLLNSSLFPVLPPPSAPPPTSISQPIPMLSGMGPAALATATATAAATDTTSPSVSAQATATAITTPHPADPCSMSIADVASTLPQMSPGQAVYSLEGRRSEQGSGSSSSSSSEKVRRILDGVTDALAWHMAQSDIPVMERPRRLVCLLLLLSHIRFIGNKGIQHLYNIKRKNVVPLYDLLLEMLDANVLSEHSACSKISQATGTQDTGSGGGGGGSQCKAMENSRNSVKSPALQSNDEPPSAKIRMTMGSEQPFDALG
ncbi:uncharacterized protein LOC116947742 isoform X2 [Petromyzon marinus]|uniref:uncharacterized protein LOC116947742 isoform X2 n=1 Tax=Petromyzon marinus TaxID=7757 RepID=UPI003F71690C